jgi:hypothetical protein
VAPGAEVRRLTPLLWIFERYTTNRFRQSCSPWNISNNLPNLTFKIPKRSGFGYGSGPVNGATTEHHTNRVFSNFNYAPPVKLCNFQVGPLALGEFLLALINENASTQFALINKRLLKQAIFLACTGRPHIGPIDTRKRQGGHGPVGFGGFLLALRYALCSISQSQSH